MKSVKTRPVVRVTATTGAAQQAPRSGELGTLDTLLAIVNAANRVRARVDGLEARVMYLEALREAPDSR